MQLKDVNTFLQIASSGSLSAAARASGKPKATISHQLRRLENELGVELFVRKANTLVLSEVGKKFLEHGNNIKRSSERGLDMARSSRNVARGTIRVASTGEFTSNLVAPLVLYFARRYPELRIEVLVGRSDSLLSSRDSLDCILYLGDPPMPQAAEMTARILGHFSYGLYASPGYLRRAGMPQNPAELRSHDLIAFHDGESTSLWELKNDREEFSLQPISKFLTNDYWALKLAAIHDHGIGFMPDFFAKMEVAEGCLAPVLPEWRSGNIPMFALFPSHRLENPNLRRLIDALSHNFQDIFNYEYYARRNEALGLDKNSLQE